MKNKYILVIFLVLAANQIFAAGEDPCGLHCGTGFPTSGQNGGNNPPPVSLIPGQSSRITTIRCSLLNGNEIATIDFSKMKMTVGNSTLLPFIQKGVDGDSSRIFLQDFSSPGRGEKGYRLMIPSALLSAETSGRGQLEYTEDGDWADPETVICSSHF